MDHHSIIFSVYGNVAGLALGWSFSASVKFSQSRLNFVSPNYVPGSLTIRFRILGIASSRAESTSA